MPENDATESFYNSLAAQADGPNAQAEMPRYKCHKEVWALKIASIAFDRDQATRENRETDGSVILTPAEEIYAPLRVDAEFVRKHKLVAGGYYVLYADGYKSFSPAKAFEGVYTRIS